MKRVNKVAHIALIFRRGYAHLERLTEGIITYAEEKDLRWSYISIPDHLDASISQLKGWHGDGAIAQLDTPEDAMAALSVGFPVVNVSSALEQTIVQRVIVDNQAIGIMAAEHLLSQHFRRFAFYGVEGPAYSRLRLKGFRTRLKQEGAACHVHLDPVSSGSKNCSWLQRQKKLEIWLKTLDTPVGIFASSDHLACMLLNACQVMNRAVPEEIAILGCNNEEPICEHGSTPLSSISRNMHQVGACAAHTLNQMMNREMTEHTEVLIPPECVVRRASTDTLAIDDPRIAKAVHFLHANLHQTEDIEALLDVLHVSRRWLEYAFRKELNVSPYRYLLNLRLQKAQELLSGSKDISIKEIAARCGFSCSKRLSVVMRREIGCGPTEYRKRTHSK